MKTRTREFEDDIRIDIVLGESVIALENREPDIRMSLHFYHLFMSLFEN